MAADWMTDVSAFPNGATPERGAAVRVYAPLAARREMVDSLLPEMRRLLGRDPDVLLLLTVEQFAELADFWPPFRDIEPAPLYPDDKIALAITLARAAA